MQATNQGIIEAVKPSKTGKTLGILMKDAQGNEQWHSTKHFELQAKQGAEIQYNASQSEFNGTVIHWLNDYQEIGTGGTTADAAFNQAMAQNQAPPMGQPAPTAVPGSGQIPPQSAPAAPTPQSSTKDRDSFIAAQALAKTLTFESAQDALNAFKYLYIQLRDWNPEAPAGEGTPFDDSIPF